MYYTGIAHFFSWSFLLSRRVWCDISQPLDKFLAIADLANNVGNIIQSARSYQNSRDPVAYVPYQIKPQENFQQSSGPQSFVDLAGKIAGMTALVFKLNNALHSICSDCDPQVYGTCCLFPNLCVKNALCTSKKPSMSLESLVSSVPKCSCLPGFIGDGRTRGTGCINVNECLTGESRCQHICQDLTPGYFCSCRDGYQLQADGVSCIDINECERGTYKCSHICINTEGSYKCDCPEGQELGEDGMTCQSINECILMQEILTYRIEMKSLKPSARTLSAKAKQFLNTLEVCQYPELCQDIDSGYYCGCPLGFRNNPDNPTECIDINECIEGISFSLNDSLVDSGTTRRKPVCSVTINEQKTQQCKNLVGAYLCSCAEGFNSSIQESQYEKAYYRTFEALKMFGALALNSFYSRWNEVMNNLNCEDINECQDHSICSASSFKASTLWSPPGDRYGVVLSEELHEREPVVQLNQEPVCINTIGSYTCQCQTGYKYVKNLKTCVDINECSDPSLNLCNEESGEECINTSGGYMCRCKTGYQLKDSSLLYHKDFPLFKKTNFTAVCTDIDECATDENPCQYKCINLPGSYQCTCPLGFEVDPLHSGQCKDIDECQLSVCPNSMACLNLPGTYICECPPGYTSKVSFSSRQDFLNNILPTLSQSNYQFLKSVIKLNENNSFISFAELKKINYEIGVYHLRLELQSNAKHCTDINECQILGKSLCPENAECVNTEGAYSCTCLQGYRKVFQESREGLKTSLLRTPKSPNNMFSSMGTVESRLLNAPFLMRRFLFDGTSGIVEDFSHHMSHTRNLLTEEKKHVESQENSLTELLPSSFFFEPFPVAQLKHLFTPSRLQKALQLNLIRSDQFQLPVWIIFSITERFEDNAVPPYLCKDIDECNEARKTVFYQNTLCSLTQPCCVNTPGGYQCVGRKRVGLRYQCPPIFLNRES